MELLDKLKSLVSSLKSIQMPTDTIVGVDIGSAIIKVVEVSKTGPRLELRTYGEVSLGVYAQKNDGMTVLLDPATLAKALTDVLTEAQIKSREVILSIPASQSLLFFLELPKSAEANLAEIIPNEARKFIPVPLSEVRLDWLIVPPIYAKNSSSAKVVDSEVSKEEHISVLVAAIRGETLSLLKQVTDTAGLSVRTYELEVFAQVRAALYRELSASVIVDLGASKTRMAVVRHGVVYINHITNIGGEQMTQAVTRATNLDFMQAESLKRMVGLTGGDARVTGVLSPIVGQILSELRSVISDFERTRGITVEKIVLIGGGSSLAGLLEMIAQSVGLSVVRSQALSRLNKPNFLDETLHRIDPEFATAVGLAMRNYE